MIYHLLDPGQWDTTQSRDVVAEPTDQGFVHCCDEHQIDGVRRRFFDGGRVVALALDPTMLAAETRYEPAVDGVGERFPHVYGPLPAHAVIRATMIE